MTNIRVPYGTSHLTAEIPSEYSCEIISPKQTTPASDPIAEVERALQQPVGTKHLEDFIGARTVSIAVNDKTRPVPHDVLLPPLMAQLSVMGIPDEAITFVIATGTHPVMPPEEYPRILPDWVIERYNIACHDCEDEANLTYLGDTQRGTPVWVNRVYREADLHLAVGNVEPHQIMGFSGGVKSVAIGVAGKQTINHNHAMMRDPNARLGQLEHNPARADVEEIGRMMRVDFVLNAILNGEKQLVAAVAGEPLAVMQNAVPQVREIFQVKVEKSFDLMIVSPGGHPKDINVYQAQKALAHARLVTKTGGTIILVAACPEGTGSQTYESWILGSGLASHDAVIHQFEQEGFRIGVHKAFQIARDARDIRVLLISEMSDDFVRQLLLEPAHNLETALQLAFVALPSHARIGVLPVANATIPALKQEQ